MPALIKWIALTSHFWQPLCCALFRRWRRCQLHRREGREVSERRRALRGPLKVSLFFFSNKQAFHYRNFRRRKNLTLMYSETFKDVCSLAFWQRAGWDDRYQAAADRKGLRALQSYRFSQFGCFHVSSPHSWWNFPSFQQFFSNISLLLTNMYVLYNFRRTSEMGNSQCGLVEVQFVGKRISVEGFHVEAWCLITAATVTFTE